MDDVTEDSLVLVDELGKGTEVRAGAAIAGAMLERLDAIRCRGIFATSVHPPRPVNESHTLNAWSRRSRNGVCTKTRVF